MFNRKRIWLDNTLFEYEFNMTIHEMDDNGVCYPILVNDFDEFLIAFAIEFVMQIEPI